MFWPYSCSHQIQVVTMKHVRAEGGGGKVGCGGGGGGGGRGLEDACHIQLHVYM